MAQESDQEDKNADQDKKGKSGWIATLGRALKDNAPLIAALLALAGVIITQVVTTNNAREGLANQQYLEDQRQREAELQTYFNDMGDMLLNDNSPLPEAGPGDPISSLARAKTLTILERLDGQPTSKRNVLQFLYESQLINKVAPVVSLRDADLRGADLEKANLSDGGDADERGADLGDVILTGADLKSANLQGAFLDDVGDDDEFARGAVLTDAYLSLADLTRADLSNAVMPGAVLEFADLIDAVLHHAVLTGADLEGADLEGAVLTDAYLRAANLGGARGVTDEQLADTWTLEEATMPYGSTHE